MKYPTFLDPNLLPLVHQGKTRDTYATNDPDLLLVVASNRLSTHNVVHMSAVPKKGEILTALTVFWLTEVLASMPNHLHAFGTDIYQYLPQRGFPWNLHHRAIIVHRAEIRPVEFIWRRYLAGSLWKDFYSKDLPDPYGLRLPPGLPFMHRFMVPVFTPTDKSTEDYPLHQRMVVQRYPEGTALSEGAYKTMRAHANARGLEMVDTKIETGLIDGIESLADEVGTPDSSRFVLLEDIREGAEPPWFDKEVARKEAERRWEDRPKTPLKFSHDAIAHVTGRYHELFERLTDRTLTQFQREYLN